MSASEYHILSLNTAEEKNHKDDDEKRIKQRKVN